MMPGTVAISERLECRALLPRRQSMLGEWLTAPPYAGSPGLGDSPVPSYGLLQTAQLLLQAVYPALR
jgi:hypothetical protein